MERLKITPAERKATAGLITLLTLLGIVNLVWSPSAPFTDSYQELDQQFKQRSEMIKNEEHALMARYYPPAEVEGLTTSATDTVPADSARTQEEPQVTEDSRSPRIINVNTASSDELQKLPGIGPAYSKRIIEYRENKGNFTAIEQLLKIKGIGKKRLEKLQPFIKLTEPE